MNVKTKDGKLLKLVGLIVIPSIGQDPASEVAWCYDRDGKPVRILIEDIETWGK